MTNSLSASFPKFWSRRMQMKYFKSAVYKAIANFEEQSTLKRGSQVTRPYRSDLVVNDMAADGAYTRQDVSATEELMNINKEREITFYVRDFDEIQSNYKLRNEWADESGERMGEVIDGDHLSELRKGAGLSLDASDGFGGTANTGIDISTSNVLRMFSRASTKMKKNNISIDNRFAVISPDVSEVLFEYLAAKNTPMADVVGENGVIGKYNKFTLYESNNLPFAARLTLSTNPSDADTFTINGVTFTFKSTLGSTAGNVKICSTAAKTITNLVTALNAPKTAIAEDTDTGYVALSAANQLLIKRIEATDGTTYVDIVMPGYSVVVVSETLTNAANIWSRQYQINLFGQGKPCDMVIQKYPSTKVKDRDGYDGVDVLTTALYGNKLFADGGKRVVSAKISSLTLPS